jgi:hypothetical protein
MKDLSVRLFSAVLVFTLFFAGPPGLAAKQKRGTTLIVTKLDGTQVSGELIAVKPESLLLLAGGTADLSVPLGEIQTVRIVRKSKIGKGMLYGFLAGALGGAAWGAANKDSDVWGEQTPVVAGGFVGAIGLAAGGFLGLVASVDTTFTVAGQPAEVVADFWARLAARSRVGRAP